MGSRLRPNPANNTFMLKSSNKMIKTLISSTFCQNVIIGRCRSPLLARYFCSSITSKQKQSPVMKSNWKIYPSDFVIKNLKPDKVPKDYQMVYRSSVETIANFCILGNGLALLVSSAVVITENSRLLEVATLSNVLGGIGLLGSIALLYFVSLRIPMRMYYSSQNNDYLVKMPRLFPYRTWSMMLQPGTVLPPESSRMKPWVAWQYTHAPSKAKLIIFEDSFSVPVYHKKLLKE